MTPLHQDPLKKERTPSPVFLPGNSYGQRSMMGYSPCSPKSVGHDLTTTEVDVQDTHHQWHILIFLVDALIGFILENEENGFNLEGKINS